MRFLYIIGMFIVFVVTQNHCMDQKVVLHLFKKGEKVKEKKFKDFPIEKYKIDASRALQKDRLRREQSCDGGEVKNMSLFYSDMNSREMKLYSDACDWGSGIGFRTGFKSLSPEDRRTLIIAVGEYDPDSQEKKLDSYAILTEICEVLFDETRVIPNDIIKSHMDRLFWIYYCRDTLAKARLLSQMHPDLIKTQEICVDSSHMAIPPYLLSGDSDEFVTNSLNIIKYLMSDKSRIPLAFRYTDDGCIQTVPSSLISGSYDGPYTHSFTQNKNETFETYKVKPIDDMYEYRITGTISFTDIKKMPRTDVTKTVEEKKNKCFLHCVNRTTNSGTSILLEHKDPIEECKFSQSGNFLLTRSKGLLLLSKITRKENDSFSVTSFPIQLSDTDTCFQAFFNQQSTALMLSFWNKENHQSSVILWDILNNNCVKKIEQERFTIGVYNHDRLLLTTSYSNDDDNNNNTAILWNIANLSHIVPIGALTDKGVLKAAGSSKGKKWAAITGNGQFILATETPSELLKLEIPLEDFSSSFDAPMTPEEFINFKIVYSPDDRFVAILYPNKYGSCTIRLYSTMTCKQLGTRRTTTVEGVGFTSDSNQLILKLGEGVWTKIIILNSDDDQNLDYLWFNTSIHQLAILRRLIEARKNKDTVELYEEEPDYKALQLLPENLLDIVKKSLPFSTVIK